jgi:hypothetical protein
VDDLVRQKIQDGQLNDCPLTLKDLAIVKESFATTLRSMLHSRIDYPKDEEKSAGISNRATPQRGATNGGRVIPVIERS